MQCLFVCLFCYVTVPGLWVFPTYLPLQLTKPVRKSDVYLPTPRSSGAKVVATTYLPRSSPKIELLLKPPKYLFETAERSAPGFKLSQMCTDGTCHCLLIPHVQTWKQWRATSANDAAAAATDADSTVQSAGQPRPALTAIESQQMWLAHMLDEALEEDEKELLVGASCSS